MVLQIIDNNNVNFVKNKEFHLIIKILMFVLKMIICNYNKMFNN